MLTVAWSVALALVMVSVLLASLRLWRGPDTLDRVLALDTMYVNAVALLVLMGWSRHGGLSFEATMLIALMGFVSTVAVGKFLLRGDVIE